MAKQVLKSNVSGFISKFLTVISISLLACQCLDVKVQVPCHLHLTQTGSLGPIRCTLAQYNVPLSKCTVFEDRKQGNVFPFSPPGHTTQKEPSPPWENFLSLFANLLMHICELLDVKNCVKVNLVLLEENLRLSRKDATAWEWLKMLQCRRLCPDAQSTYVYSVQTESAFLITILSAVHIPQGPSTSFPPHEDPFIRLD
ncbi:hypothetical protein EMCRGX_G017439 [Ephydatia muelleri]